jgi:hypothetical protein
MAPQNRSGSTRNVYKTHIVLLTAIEQSFSEIRLDPDAFWYSDARETCLVFCLA